MSGCVGVYQIQRPQANHFGNSKRLGKGGRKQPSRPGCSLCLTSWEGTKDVRSRLFRISVLNRLDS
jgi:hypothetical protein